LFNGQAKTGAIAAMILFTVVVGCWFAYTAWKQAEREASQWRIVNDEMQELLHLQSGTPPSPGKPGDAAGAAKQAAGTTAPGTKAQPDNGAVAPAPSPTQPSAGNPPVPEQDRQAGAAEQPASPQPSKSKVNLNTATLQQLDELPGIGESKAKAIIAHREKLGGKFRSVDQLLDVKGIGEKMLEKMRPLITVEP